MADDNFGTPIVTPNRIGLSCNHPLVIDQLTTLWNTFSEQQEFSRLFKN